MSKLPSPFQQDLPKILTSSPTSSSPGFLMMTRPPSASSEGSSRTNFRGNYRSGYNQRGQGPYSNTSPSGFTPFRNQNNFQNNRGGQNQYQGNFTPQTYGKQKSLPTPSPNRNFFNNNMRSFSGSHTYQSSTPNNSKFSYNNNNGKQFNNSSFFNSNKSKHDTPLKDIPVDKFVSRNMMNDPWSNIPTNMNLIPKGESMPTDRASENVDYSIDDDGASTNQSLSTTEIADSPLKFGTLSEGDTETESDAGSDI